MVERAFVTYRFVSFRFMVADIPYLEVGSEAVFAGGCPVTSREALCSGQSGRHHTTRNWSQKKK